MIKTKMQKLIQKIRLKLDNKGFKNLDNLINN